MLAQFSSPRCMIKDIVRTAPVVQDKLPKKLTACSLFISQTASVYTLPHFFPSVYPSLVSLRSVHTSLPPPFIAVFGDKPPLVGQWDPFRFSCLLACQKNKRGPKRQLVRFIPRLCHCGKYAERNTSSFHRMYLLGLTSIWSHKWS